MKRRGACLREDIILVHPRIDALSSGRRLGLALLTLGVVVLVAGIISHSTFERALSERRDRLYEASLLHRAVRYHATPTYVAAVLLLAIGLLAIADVAFKVI